MANDRALDVHALSIRTWKLFSARLLDHVLAALIVVSLSVLSLGLLAGPLTAGWIRMCEKQRRGQTFGPGDVFSGFEVFWPAFFGSIIGIIGVLLGCVALVVPGLLLACTWQFAMHFVALEGTGGVEALGRSWRTFWAQPSAMLTVFVLDVVLSLIAGGSVVLSVITAPLGVLLTYLAFTQIVQGEEPDAEVTGSATAPAL